MRGCSLVLLTQLAFSQVFPAYAGVFPSGAGDSGGKHRLPRVCGGVPAVIPALRRQTKSSPRMRGCSYVELFGRPLLLVFPAYAGVFLFMGVDLMAGRSLPRVCGGVPTDRGFGLRKSQSSPRMRGCSRQGSRLPEVRQVFPAYAGVFP